jgi:hypothetical protein
MIRHVLHSTSIDALNDAIRKVMYTQECSLHFAYP